MKVRGVYDGTHIRLLEPVSIPPNTEVEVYIDERQLDPEEAYWGQLEHLGLITGARHRAPVDDSFEPIPNPGEPISDTIIRERR
jgi:hypothetical protein